MHEGEPTLKDKLAFPLALGLKVAKTIGELSMHRLMRQQSRDDLQPAPEVEAEVEAEDSSAVPASQSAPMLKNPLIKRVVDLRRDRAERFSRSSEPDASSKRGRNSRSPKHAKLEGKVTGKG